MLLNNLSAEDKKKLESILGKGIVKKVVSMEDKKRAKKCPFCNKDMSNAMLTDFADEISWREFNISGGCQKCQDRFFL